MPIQSVRTWHSPRHTSGFVTVLSDGLEVSVITEGGYSNKADGLVEVGFFRGGNTVIPSGWRGAEAEAPADVFGWVEPNEVFRFIAEHLGD